MGSLCNTPVMFSLTNQVTAVARALKVMKVREEMSLNTNK